MLDLGQTWRKKSNFEKFPSFSAVHEAFAHPGNVVVMREKLDMKVRKLL